MVERRKLRTDADALVIHERDVSGRRFKASAKGHAYCTRSYCDPYNVRTSPKVVVIDLAIVGAYVGMRRVCSLTLAYPTPSPMRTLPNSSPP